MVEAPSMEAAAELDTSDSKALTPPYISFLMFLNCVEWLEQAGIPHRIDRSFWSQRYSGSSGPQVLTALRFLRLLENDRPRPKLEQLVQAKGEERKAILQEILQEAYTHVNFDLLSRATPGMVNEWISRYPGEGDTKRKMESFFVNALKYTEYPLPPALKKMARNRPSKARGASGRRIAGTGSKPAEGVGRPAGTDPGRTPTPSPKANVRAVELESGGNVTLSISVDLFDLSEEDRKFVVGLIDAVRGYQQIHSKPEEPDDKAQ